MTAVPPGAGPEDDPTDPRVVMHGEAHDSSTLTQIATQTNYNIQLLPAPADEAGVATYLSVLIRWLSDDPWLMQLPGASPRQVELEKKLSIADTATGVRADADERAAASWRLVVLGGPGSGKTWLARRIARRCAQDALRQLDAGASVADIEIPLFATCADFARAEGDVRDAVLASALDHVADLGGSRLSGALRALLRDRNDGTLLVLDSLDEATGAHVRSRLRQAGSLGWRIILTSRPGSWNKQLPLTASPDQAVAELQPMSYPGDIEPFVATWFAAELVRGADLLAQLARSSRLRQAATIPLILAFYCILADGSALPRLRRDLYSRVLGRILTGAWRDGDGTRPDITACTAVLQEWATTGAVSDPVSGIGAWPDEVPVTGQRLTGADQQAVDHVAVPVRQLDEPVGTVSRRFIHRSVREHLLAGYFTATSTAASIAAELVPHLWFDADWENAAPAIVAARADRDDVLALLLGSAVGEDMSLDAIRAADSTWELRGFLARLAAESRASDWTEPLANLLGAAVRDIITDGPATLLTVIDAGHWPDVAAGCKDAIITALERETGPAALRQLGTALLWLDPEPSDLARARRALLANLAAGVRRLSEPPPADPPEAPDAEHPDAQLPDGELTAAIADVLASLRPNDDELTTARAAVSTLRLAARRSQMLPLAEALARLDPSEAELRDAHAGLLARARTTLSSTPLRMLLQSRSRLLLSASETEHVWEAFAGLLTIRSRHGTRRSLTRLACTGEDLLLCHPPEHVRVRAAAQIVEAISKAGNPTSGTGLAGLGALADVLDELGPAPADRAHCQVVLLHQLDQINEIGDPFTLPDDHAVSTDDIEADTAQIAYALGRIGAPPSHLDQVRTLLIDTLVQCPASRLVAHIRLIGNLDPTETELKNLRMALVTSLGAARRADAADVAQALLETRPTDYQKSQARQGLLARLRDEKDKNEIANLADRLTDFDPTDADLTQARDACAQELAAALDSGESEHAETVLKALATLRLPAGDLLGARREVARLLVTDIARDAGPPSPAQLDRLREVRALVPAADWRAIVQASGAARRTRQQ